MILKPCVHSVLRTSGLQKHTPQALSQHFHAPLSHPRRHRYLM